MEQIVIYVVFFCIIVIVSQLFSKLIIPVALILIFTGIVLSFIPKAPVVNIYPQMVLNIFLPILVYQISAFSSWKEFKKNFRQIAQLSISHVIFITFIVACVFHWLIPSLGWPLAFVIGAVVSPPDDVAIVSIAEKIRMPSIVINILEGEGMLNDGTALTLFHFALAAELTHQFLFANAILTFILVIFGETFYGLVLGYVIGEIRCKIQNPSLHVLASLVTPFIAYLPAKLLGGSGIVATVTTGFIIGNFYSTRFTPQFRLISRAMWPALSYGVQSILFLLVGYNMRSLTQKIAVIPLKPLCIYIFALIATLIIGRFVWVYVFFKRSQFPFLISWSGMRGSISLAAAMAIPFLTETVYGAPVRDLFIFLVLSMIVVTFFLQSLALPWILKRTGIDKITQCEEFKEHITEIKAHKAMTTAVLSWLNSYKKEVKEDQRLYEEVKLFIEFYKMQKIKWTGRLRDHEEITEHNQELETAEDTALQLRIIEIERNKVLELWRNEKINLNVREKMLDQLDHRARNVK